jgi:hypothetical protein
MGNCGASQHAVESWADDGEEWEEEADEPWSEEERHRLHGRGQMHEVHQHATEEVTIWITGRQLQQLIETKNQAPHGGLVGTTTRRSTEQLLADIINSGEVHQHEEEHSGGRRRRVVMTYDASRKGITPAGQRLSCLLDRHASSCACIVVHR